MSKTASSPVKLGVVFGSRSVEHEVSIITATQLMRSVDRTQYELVPLYIDKQGRWWTGDALADIATFQTLDLENPQHPDIQPLTFAPDPTQDHGIDVAIFCLHGGHGEDGTMAGLFELANIPYAGLGVVGAAVAIDKIITKHVCETAGFPVTPYVWFSRTEWEAKKSTYLDQIHDLQAPWFVKPATLGSSVGVTRVDSPDKLIEAIELALSFDARVIVEQGAHDCIEVNVSVIGTGGEYETSVTEQPIATDEFLSYTDKYARGGGKKGGSKGMASLSRRIPAPISPQLSEKIQDVARQLWHLVDGCGVARIDFFADPSSEEIFVGELNAPPGSMAFYLWEATGKSYPALIDHLVEQAQRRHQEKTRHMHSIPSNILQLQGDQSSKR